VKASQKQNMDFGLACKIFKRRNRRVEKKLL